MTCLLTHSEEEAAIKIQAAIRGYLARVHTLGIVEEKLEEERQLCAASWTAIDKNLLEFALVVFRR